MAYIGRIASLCVCVVVVFVGCSKSPIDEGNNPEIQQIISQELEKREGYFNQLVELMDSGSVDEAKVTILARIRQNPEVEWADTTDEAILIQYKRGGRSALVTCLEFYDSLDTFVPAPVPVNRRSVTGSSAPEEYTVNASNMLIFNSVFTEFNFLFNDATPENGNKTYYERVDASLATLGITRITRYLDTQVTMFRLRNLEGFDIIHFTGHGIRWKNPVTHVVEEIYYLTGQDFTGDVLGDYFEEYIDYDFIDITRTPHGAAGPQTKICVAPRFVTASADLSQEKSFVVFEFCRSWLGRWKTSFLQDAKAGTCLGWDQAVSGRRTTTWTARIYGMMCDTSFPSAVTTQEAYAVVNPKYQKTLPNGTKVWVTMQYAGDSTRSFWKRKPVDPGVLGSVSLPTAPRDVAVEGDYAYVIDKDSTITVIDISSPASPVIARSLSFNTHSTGRGIAISSGNAYVGAGSFHLFDLSTPPLPVRMSGQAFSADCGDLRVNGSYAYIAAGKNPSTSIGLFAVADITDPADQTKNRNAAGVELPGSNIRAVDLAGTFAYLVDTDKNRLRIVDISDPLHPSEVGDTSIALTPAGSRAGIAISGTHAVVAFSGLSIFDVSDPSVPKRVFTAADDIYNVAVSEPNAYIVGPASGGKGYLAINDISDKTSPKFVKTIALDGSGVSIAIAGSMAYVAETKGDTAGILAVVKIK